MCSLSTVHIVFYGDPVYSMYLLCLKGQCHKIFHLCFFLKRSYGIYSLIPELKGSVQRKLRWVENGVNRSAGASDCGAGCSFVILFGFHLGFAIFPFPVSTAQIIGEL